jgi:hypothetical protein
VFIAARRSCINFYFRKFARFRDHFLKEELKKITAAEIPTQPISASQFPHPVTITYWPRVTDLEEILIFYCSFELLAPQLPARFFYFKKCARFC